MSFFKELKRRNVFRVVIAYVIIAWLLLQVGDTLAPALRLPEWVNSTLAFFLILGFPLAIFFAWAYELTPGGIKKEKDIDRTQSVTHVTGRKLDYLIIAVLVAALGYFAFDKFVLDPSRDAALVQVTTEAVTEQVGAEPELSTVSKKSIAVLPFENMSSDAEQEYFSDGLSDTLIHVLAQVSGLKVTAKTSSFYFKGKNINVAEIASELKVGTILEGSVQRYGKKARITVQLIDAKNDDHIWADSYDRDIEDVFQTQSEIAIQVASELDAILTSDQRTQVLEDKTSDIKAFELYQMGRFYWNKRNGDGYKKSITYFEQAIEME